MTLKNLFILPLLAAAMLVSCSDDDSRYDHATGKNLNVFLKFNNSFSEKGTRATTQPINDQDEWSYRDLTVGDVIGFYSDVKQGDPLINFPLMMENSTTTDGKVVYNFVPYGSDIDWNVTTLRSSGMFMYFPYDENISSDNFGRPLRVKKEPYSDTSFPDGPWRCLDFLTSSLIDASNISDGTLSGTLVHAFSELIIMRGEGFDNPPEDIGEDRMKIWIKLKEPYTHIKVNCSTSSKFSVLTELYYDSNYKPEGVSDNKNFDASVWEAWEGGKYGLTEEDKEGFPASYVILPTIGYDLTELGLGKYRETKRSEVEYIQLYDNEGILQTVKNLPLSGTTGNLLNSGWRYPLIIAMQELVPTVFPFTIKEWNNGNITNKRTRGIRQDNFESWLLAYNNTETPDAILSQYGDKINISGGDSYWHFYILENLDLSVYSNQDVVIPKLRDVIDGKTSPGSSPVTISGLAVPFVGTMTNKHDTIKNLIFSRPEIIETGINPTPIGALVKTLNTGGIVNCIVEQGYISTSSAVGMLCGNLEIGSIVDCKASGVVLGSSTQTGTGALIGQWSSTHTFTGNNSSVVFSNTVKNDN